MQIGYDNAPLFSSVTVLIKGVISALLEKKTMQLLQINFVMLRNGSRSIITRYIMAILHNSPDSLSQRLNKTSANKTFAGNRRVFSMDGDKAPLREIATISKKNIMHG